MKHGNISEPSPSPSPPPSGEYFSRSGGIRYNEGEGKHGAGIHIKYIVLLSRYTSVCTAQLDVFHNRVRNPSVLFMIHGICVFDGRKAAGSLL